MITGSANPNSMIPIKKMCITNLVTKKKIYVLYNPESYTQERSTQYSEATGLASNAPSIQFMHGSTETLRMELFFDSYTAASEVGGSVIDKIVFAINSLAPSPTKMDVRKYTSKIYDLMLIDSSTHVPPLLKIEWSSLQFKGHLVSCTQRFTKFSEDGAPVRATLSVMFKQYTEPSQIAAMKPNESPDTAKYRTVHQGDSLWGVSAKEYGQCDMWRVIARANNIENPRLLNTGDIIRLPALK